MASTKKTAVALASILTFISTGVRADLTTDAIASATGMSKFLSPSL